MAKSPIASTWRSRVSAARMPLIVGLLVCVIFGAALMALTAGPPGRAALVARADLSAGAIPQAADLVLVSLPVDAVPEGALADLSALEDKNLTRGVAKSTVLTQGHFSGAENLIPPGKSRILIEVPSDRVSVVPGDHVQIWGPSNACIDTESELALLAENAVIEDILAPSSAGTFAGPSTSQIGILVASTDVAAVLCATVSGTVHFVVSSG